MCNLYSMTKPQSAIRELVGAIVDTSGNLPSLPAIFPDLMAPVVVTRPNDGHRELLMRMRGILITTHKSGAWRDRRWERGAGLNRREPLLGKRRNPRCRLNFPSAQSSSFERGYAVRLLSYNSRIAAATPSQTSDSSNLSQLASVSEWPIATISASLL